MAIPPSNTEEKPCLPPPLSHESSTHRMAKALAKMIWGEGEEGATMHSDLPPKSSFPASLDLHVSPKETRRKTSSKHHVFHEVSGPPR